MENTPYQSFAGEYLANGWDVLPLPLRSKKTPPKGYTGEDAIEIDEELALGDWMETGGNVALRLPDGVIGIDIDAYKDGGATLKRLIKKLGALPETIGITSRASVDDGVTLFFAVPLGARFKGSEGSIDIIQKHHRYSVAPPSIHPEGRAYRWVSSSGFDIPWTPEVDSFPTLPDAWLNHFLEASKISKEDSQRKEALESSVQTEIDFAFPAGTACKKMNSLLKGAIIRLRENQNSRHDSMVLSTWAFTGEAAKGHTGYDRVIAAYASAWKKSFNASESNARPLELEFDSALRGAQRKIPRTGSVCSCERENMKAKKTSSGLKMWR